MIENKAKIFGALSAHCDANERMQEAGKTVVQSVILSKESFADSTAAAAWCEAHGFSAAKVDETGTSFRFRQRDPEECQKGTFRVIDLTDGVKAVVCQPAEMQESVQAFQGLPVAEAGTEWDAVSARSAVKAWATEGDTFDPKKYGRAFVVVDGPAENEGSYKLPIATVINGNLTVIPKAVSAALAAAHGARGTMKLSPVDRGRVVAHLLRYQKEDEKMQESVVPNGEHAHPHAHGGLHANFGFPVGGAHAHSGAPWSPEFGGAHAHAEGEPLEGYHVQDSAEHQHVLALEKKNEKIAAWHKAVVDAHFPKHVWMDGHVATYVQVEGVDASPRLADREFWEDHFLWAHAGKIGYEVEDIHEKMYPSQGDEKAIKLWYLFVNGLLRPSNRRDFCEEERWFNSNLPSPFGEGNLLTVTGASNELV